jgi:C-terminal processing protease CtpA/Prc
MKNSVIILVLLGLFSCEKIIFEKEIDDSNEEVFEYFWERMNSQYAFFELKGVDWDEMYKKNRPLVTNDLSEDSLFIIMGNMMIALNDAHTGIFATINGKYRRAKATLDTSKITFNFETTSTYLSDVKEHQGTYYTFTTGFLSDNKIGYFNYPSFGEAHSESFFSDIIQERFASTEGLIIDIRSNGGGSDQNVRQLAGYISSEEVLGYTTYLKNGSGHHDFQAGISYYFGGLNTNPPPKVVVLTDRGSFSAASFLPLVAKQMPNTIVMGDTTGGGISGTKGVVLPNGWRISYSNTRVLAPTGENWENGVPPDVFVEHTDTDDDNGKDPVLERAIDEILN